MIPVERKFCAKCERWGAHEGLHRARMKAVENRGSGETRGGAAVNLSSWLTEAHLGPVVGRNADADGGTLDSVLAEGGRRTSCTT